MLAIVYLLLEKISWNPIRMEDVDQIDINVAIDAMLQMSESELRVAHQMIAYDASVIEYHLNWSNLGLGFDEDSTCELQERFDLLTYLQLEMEAHGLCRPTFNHLMFHCSPCR